MFLDLLRAAEEFLNVLQKTSFVARSGVKTKTKPKKTRRGKQRSRAPSSSTIEDVCVAEAVNNMKGETADADGSDKDETTLPPYVDPLCLTSAPPHRLQYPAPAQVGAESPSTVVEVKVMPSLPSVKLSSSDAACEQPPATENGGSRGSAPTPSLSPVRSPVRCDSVVGQPSPMPQEATEVKEEVPSRMKEHPVFPPSQQSTPLPLQEESKKKKKKARPSAHRRARSRTCVPEEIQPEASISASSSSPDASHPNARAPSDPSPCKDVPRCIRSDDQPEAVSPVAVDEDGEGLHCSTVSAAPATACESKLQASPSLSNPNDQVDPPVPLAQSSATMTESAFVSPSPTAQVRDESRAPFPATQQIMPEPNSSTALPPFSPATCIPKWQKKTEKQQARKAQKKGGVDKLHWWQFRSDPTGCATPASPTEDVPKQHEETTETPNAPLPQPGGPPI
uniref:Uncharacterized protein n=1 Tax=Chromera velia CCMP2878 TaxID=1169474 RepID=A0A0G4FT22_9ALVE|eukprot:Cvel_18537.t1-p1 / transcript=Cvel_18537.t1 / gene=Cvel_18537 / organism=Chromera_velia_CCMP2878 / gene_product=hypothetical protein / transcript_product=hypothetical protein / location=Cvel_scaffold1542:15918-17267(-) / protein_length=450 / sequence_SO=supercontig / SO=protein_coding / is_pseudo=false